MIRGGEMRVMGVQEFYDVRREVAKSGWPYYSFVERENHGTRITVYRKKDVLVYLNSDCIFRISPNEKIVKIPLGEVKEISIEDGVWDSEIICYFTSRATGVRISFGDHSYVRGGHEIAEVLRLEFRKFIEIVQEDLVNLGYSQRATFEARGPAPRAVGCLWGILVFVVSPMLLTSFMLWGISDKTQHEIDSQALPVTLAIMVMCFVFLAVFTKVFDLFNPWVEYEPPEFPEYVLELADRSITHSCRNRKKRGSGKASSFSEHGKT